MKYSRMLAVLVSVALLTATLPTAGAVTTVSSVSASTEEAGYALREAQSPELAEFQGGWHGAVIGFFVLVFVVWLVFAVFLDHHPHGVSAHIHGHGCGHKWHGGHWID